MTAENRRQQIIDVAIRLFSQKGFRGTTTKEIALAAGVNEAIIFRHFATKRDLYSAIIDQKACATEMVAKQAEVAKAIEQRNDRKLFETLAMHILESHDNDDTFMRLMFYSALEGHELSDMFFRNQVAERYREIATYIKERIHEGAFRKVDPNIAVRAFFGMVIHHAQTKRFFNQSLGDQKSTFSNRIAAERFTDLFLAGIANPDQPGNKRK
ncbi:MAG: TetR/AcrR family transcriptional regulator [Acidobacteria bacterium]|nr:TetR/AcrR family transcriptional regulator [Acidobacteriota bacterium]